VKIIFSKGIKEAYKRPNLESRGMFLPVFQPHVPMMGNSRVENSRCSKDINGKDISLPFGSVLPGGSFKAL
jgi:hypothetical protein